jgi:hypothetical protein
MSCGINNPVMVVYDISGSGIKMPSRYNENDLVGDMLRIMLNGDTKMMEVPVDASVSDESTVYDEDAEPTDTPLVSVIPGTTPAPISLPSTSISVPTVEITTAMLTPSTIAPVVETTTSTPTVETTTSIAPVVETTTISTPTVETTSTSVEYFTNKLKCTEKKNYLTFGIIIAIFILVIILVLQNSKKL